MVVLVSVILGDVVDWGPSVSDRPSLSLCSGSGMVVLVSVVAVVVVVTILGNVVGCA